MQVGLWLAVPRSTGGCQPGLSRRFDRWPFVGILIDLPTLTLNEVVYVGLLESPFPTNLKAFQFLALDQSEYSAFTQVQDILHLLDGE